MTAVIGLPAPKPEHARCVATLERCRARPDPDLYAPTDGRRAGSLSRLRAARGGRRAWRTSVYGGSDDAQSCERRRDVRREHPAPGEAAGGALAGGVAALGRGRRPPCRGCAFGCASAAIERVRARVVVLRLPRRAPVARISLGWVRTGRKVTARWPAGVTLRQGRYLVRLHVKDSRGRVLRRTRVVARARADFAFARRRWRARSSRRRRRSCPRRRRRPAAAASSRWRARSPSAASTRASAPVAPTTSTRARTSPPPRARRSSPRTRASSRARASRPSGAGEYVVLDAADGRDYFFAHCLRRSTVVAEGAAVAAGAPLCLVGATGTASGPHLHFEIWNVGWRVPGGHPIDPLPELLAWAPR